MNSVFGFRQFRLHGCLSYIVFDRATREALVVDPSFGLLNDFRDFLAANGLKPKTVVDTELYSDEFSASHVFRSEWDAEIAMSAKTASARATRKLGAAERLTLGALEFTVIETPGHAPDAIALHEKKQGILFSGDTLLIGGGARADYEGDAQALYQSLHQLVTALPAETLVFPSRDEADHLFSTIQIEKSKNQDLLLGHPEFLEKKNAARFKLRSEEARRCYDYNRTANPGPEATRVYNSAAPAPREASGSLAKINVEKYQSKLGEKSPDTLFVDVREPDEFQEARIPGTTNIPLSELAFHLSEIQGKKRIYLSCLSGRRASMAAQTLGYLGHPDVVNVSGGFQAWANAGLPVEKS
ncbi:MAG: MBL fold metallo-hydrolase [Bdellovibrionota bacterium]